MNEFRMWSLFDAADNPIFTSNDKEKVEAGLARLVSEDPRLARVLRLDESTVTFHGREAPVKEDVGVAQTVCVLPWLPPR